ncbi:NUDIX hydrolase [Paenibacillus sp. J22TS3]|uniref:NUDIX hydrolase n=1 Tax=Paenibacillus sp. J22TS3 TaxID=2807192 RepID=UPI001B0744D5|nr:NUDIX hydrolase [Paenibacillus sp. J22TS3]GIP21657.1 ADP-ribose pyrophosphatase [Paenibacillus sp. J22TS3]
MDLRWLEWAKQIQAISQNGLAYSKDIYDLERFEQLRELSIEILNEYSDVEPALIRELFASETGYATPKVDIRGVIVKEDQVLLVREKADGGWALPGGWADIGLSPKEIVVKEVEEEAGLKVAPVRLLGVLDKKFHHHPPSPYHVYKIFILCEAVSGEAAPGIETSEVGYFAEDQLPELSLERNTPEQIRCLLQMVRNQETESLLD